MTGAERREGEQLQARLTALSARLAAWPRQPDADPQQRGEVVRQRDGARKQLEDFQRRVYLAHPELRAQRAEFEPVTLADLNRTLFAREARLAVVSYLVDREETLLFVATRGPSADGPAALAVHRVKVAAKDLTGEVEAFRRACQNRAAEPDSEQLFAWLLAPAADQLAGVRHVVLIPDGVLHTLPFQALKDPDGKYLLERYSVSYAPSATALVKMAELADRRRAADRGPGTLLAVGVSAFGGRQPELPAAEPEARAVAGPFGPRATVLLGAGADRAAVLRAAGSARWLHFATHGILNEVAPLYSALALAAAPGDDGLLYAHDLLGVKLQAEMVVLSACRTAEGQRVSGEGVLGLAWSLFAAGAPCCVATQWAVADASTGALMAEFYARLARGAGKAEALRQAQLALLKDRKTRHPLFWAPFVLIGDGGG
jgi:CHAT domain-containing protein